VFFLCEGTEKLQKMACKAVKKKVAPRRKPAPKRASARKPKPAKKAKKASRKPAARRAASKKRVSTRKAARKSAVRKSVAKKTTRRAAKKVVARKVRMRKASKKISTKKKRAARKSKKRATVKRRRKAKRLSLRAQRNRVMRGAMSKTKTGLTKDNLTFNKNGKIVSKKKNDLMTKRAATKGSWIWCMKEARKQLNITGFVKLNRGDDGVKLYKRAKLLQQNGGNMPGLLSQILGGTSSVAKPTTPSPKSVSFEVPTAENRKTYKQEEPVTRIHSPKGPNPNYSRVDEGTWFSFGC